MTPTAEPGDPSKAAGRGMIAAPAHPSLSELQPPRGRNQPKGGGRGGEVDREKEQGGKRGGRVDGRGGGQGEGINVEMEGRMGTDEV